ncbi:hypothetical protein CH063_06909 [Colletotrichum higginsianum]|uniref:Uncharacterized protein n=1 Tax=Colletotrichum higginsianum (strain IMI 349063) TaxID=759273 RepID=H1V494_COLHI|nr:hypothetical protein CH063_06909 [Colletotrichum higginsianum]
MALHFYRQQEGASDWTTFDRPDVRLPIRPVDCLLFFGDVKTNLGRARWPDDFHPGTSVISP